MDLLLSVMRKVIQNLLWRYKIANNLKNTLEALGLVEWQHVTVRRKAGNQVEYLGGGMVPNVIKRFGDRTIKKSQFLDGVFVIYVE